MNTPGGYGIKVFPPLDGGEGIRMIELVHYLDELAISYDLTALRLAVDEKIEKVCFLGPGECPAVDEKYKLEISSDFMSAVMRFFAPSETGKRLNFNEIINDLRFKNVVSGIQMSVLQDHFMSENFFCTDLTVAKGKEPKHGEDDRIEYYFNTDVHAKPEMKEDGTVDYFNLNMINHCKAGELLARIIRAEAGEKGMNIQGKPILPREQKRCTLRHGNNIHLSEDGLSISSKVDGHVMLVDNDVFVSDVYIVENVDTSTGNIDYSGSVQVNGNVASNYVVNAGGNVIINGVVEGAQITAGGNIIIARGVNGMGKGVLKADGNVIAKFIENTTVEAKGYVNAGSILHSNVNAGTEIEVDGKRGFITGGHVQAGSQVTVKTLGALMGASTIVEVGVDPKLKATYTQLQKDVTELVKVLKNGQAVIANFAEKRAKGARFSEDQIKYVKDIAQKLEAQKKELATKSKEMEDIRVHFDLQSRAKVVVKGEVHPGTTIIIGELSMVVQNKYQFCKFEVVQGDVKSLPL